MIEKELLERYLAEGLSLPEIGRLVARPAGTVGYWVTKYGLVANGKHKFSGKGPLDRERLTELVESGLTLRAIADEMNVTLGRVRHWIARYELGETGHLKRTAKIREAREAGSNEIWLECPKHGLTRYWIGKVAVRCRKCNTEGVVNRRRRVKEILVAEAGGRCLICGYNKSPRALHFHHLDPSVKEFGIALSGVTRSIDSSREEMKKCVLLCSNCHMEVEGGDTELPLP